MALRSSNSTLQTVAIMTLVGSAGAADLESSWPAPSDTGAAAREEDVTYEALMERGIRLRRERHDREALELFRKAYGMQPTPKALAQVALAEHGLGLWLDAERNLVKALEQADAWIERNRGALETSLVAVRKNLGELRISCSAPGASVTLDGKPFGPVTTATLRVPAGPTRVEILAPGYAPATRLVNVVAEQLEQVDCTLVEDVALPRRPDPNPRRTRHREPSPVAPAATAPPSATEPLAWALAAGAGVLLVEAFVAQWQRERAIGHFNDDERCLYGDLSREERCGAYHEIAESAQTLALVGYVAGALAASGSAWLFLSPRVHTGHVAMSHQWQF